MNGVYKFISNGQLGFKPVSAFYVCNYNEDLRRYEETSEFCFMSEDEVGTLTYL
jgi:hypothetical protein